MDKGEILLAQALTDLNTRMGVGQEVLLPGELRALVMACEKVADPYKEINADLCGIPVRVAEGVYFWRLTVGASVWLDQIEGLLPKGTGDKLYRLCLIYALINSRNKAAFEEIDDLKAIRKRVKKCFKSLTATPEEINRAMDRIFDLKKTVSKENDLKSAADWAALCARLETQTGIPASEWIWERSGSYLCKCYRDLHQFAEAYSANGRSSHLLDELDDAVNDLQTLKVNIMKRVKHG